MPRVDQSNAGIERGIEHRHDVIPRKREDVPHARARQRPCQRIGPAARFHLQRIT